MQNFIAGLITILLFAVLIVAGPLALIASLNTLFPTLAIKYGLFEWFSAAFLMWVFANNVKSNKE